ncbi:MAG: hypothetical protein P857_890 [Candidatus Xenolissoclinum pacificiensis L6]|uniref:Uncharacterized protein n=1 Tax=Candidatus Xenolissoclinum pacificiensis L6 TaxID=1401685 RepID=W2V2S2_9RICK|nr:MAG: hypothetical protein P857_890 [Candidatus Xenolissoclinum pacificiensis L6]
MQTVHLSKEDLISAFDKLAKDKGHSEGIKKALYDEFVRQKGGTPDGIQINDQEIYGDSNHKITSNHGGMAYANISAPIITPTSVPKVEEVVGGQQVASNKSRLSAVSSVKIDVELVTSETVTFSTTNTLGGKIGGKFKGVNLEFSYSLAITSSSADTVTNLSNISNNISVNLDPFSESNVIAYVTRTSTDAKFVIPIRITSGLIWGNYPSPHQGHYFWGISLQNALLNLFGTAECNIEGTLKSSLSAAGRIDITSKRLPGYEDFHSMDEKS